MSKLVSLTVVLLMALVSTGLANEYTDAGADHLASNADNWADGLPVAGTSTEWAEMTYAGTVCLIDSTVNLNPTGIYVGVGAKWDDATSTKTPAVNEWYITGGQLTSEYVNVTRGRSDSEAFGYLEMSGGTIDCTGWFNVPEQFNLTDGRPWDPVAGETVSGLMEMTGGVVNTAHLKLGTGEVDVYSGGYGTINLSGDAHFNVTVDGYQAFSADTPAGSLNISGDARFTMLGDKVQLLTDMITNGGLVNNTGQAPYYDGGQNLTIIPEPATMILLGLGGLLIRRKR